MTDATGTPTPAPGKTPLDMGKMISDTFSIYFKNILLFFIIVFIPYLGYTTFVTNVIGGYDANSTDYGQMARVIGASSISLFLVLVLVQSVIVRVAISLKVGQGPAIGKAILATISGIVPILLFSIMVGIILLAGYLFFIVPGLYLTGMFFVLIPVIVFENAGFNAFNRTVQLTEGYRWIILGTSVVLGIIVSLAASVFSGVVIGIVMAAGAFDIESMMAGTMVYPWWYLALDAAANALTLPISLISAGVIYARLKQIKEGGETGDLLKVFE